jgi:glutaredoxin 3
MAKIIIYSTNHCPYCSNAKRLFELKKANYTEINIENDPEKQDEMIRLTGRRSVPQIFINDQHIGGCDDLYALNTEGKLDELLKN